MADQLIKWFRRKGKRENIIRLSLGQIKNKFCVDEDDHCLYKRYKKELSRYGRWKTSWCFRKPIKENIKNKNGGKRWRQKQWNVFF